MAQFISLAYFWSNEIMVKNTVEMTGLSERAVIDLYNFFREVCSFWISRITRPIGGVGHIVQIDETVVSDGSSEVTM